MHSGGGLVYIYIYMCHVMPSRWPVTKLVFSSEENIFRNRKGKYIWF